MTKTPALRRIVTLALLAFGLALSATSQARTNVVGGGLTGTINWYRTNVYILNGMVFVRSNAVLNIEAGTVIKGRNLNTFGTNVGSLVICRGARIYAEGTPQNPIIFTAESDDTTFPDDLDIYQRGLWGGVVILGQTTINGALDAFGKNANPIYEVYEGLQDIAVGGESVLRFGGNNDNDNSGVLRYVSIRHGGAQLATDKEINGLSLGAVGRGTTIEFVEAYAIADDGFEFFGGTVNTKYLVSAFCDDDSFDVDMGYRGTNQFWFSIQAPDKRNYGLELNNQINEIATPDLLTPQSDFKVYNATIIGSGTGNTNVNGGRGAGVILRPYAGPKIYNSIFTDFNERGIELETRNTVNGAVSVTNGYAQFHNTIWWGFVTGSGSANVDNSISNLSRDTVASNYWSAASLSNQIANPMLTSISRTNIGATLDPRPQAGSPAYSGAASTPTSLIAANYEGAFGPGRSDWASDWTALSEYGIITGAGGINPLNITPSGPVTPNQPNLTVAHNGANLDITFPTQTGFNYQLQSSTDLSANPVDWQPDGSAVPGTGSSVTLSRTIGASGAKFFRVVIP
jgi:trimeric autotransporter adhesin